MLSVPGLIAAEKAEKAEKRFGIHLLMRAAMFYSLFSFTNNIHIIGEKGGTSSHKASNNDSNHKIKITGCLKKSLVSKED